MPSEKLFVHSLQFGRGVKPEYGSSERDSRCEWWRAGGRRGQPSWCDLHEGQLDEEMHSTTTNVVRAKAGRRHEGIIPALTRKVRRNVYISRFFTGLIKLVIFDGEV